MNQNGHQRIAAALKLIDEAKELLRQVLANQEAEEAAFHPRRKAPPGLRIGSKNHRIYAATVQLLQQQSPLHIDDLLIGIKRKQPHIFNAVSDPRINLCNVLSILKNKQLLMSDHRGNWWLA